MLTEIETNLSFPLEQQIYLSLTFTAHSCLLALPLNRRTSDLGMEEEGTIGDILGKYVTHKNQKVDHYSVHISKWK